jgi:hypothetical protein
VQRHARENWAARGRSPFATDAHADDQRRPAPGLLGLRAPRRPASRDCPTEVDPVATPAARRRPCTERGPPETGHV